MRSPTKKELSLIFPQHNEETILTIYDQVIESLGEESHAFILPTCIEKLLELSDDHAWNVNNINDYKYNDNRQCTNPTRQQLTPESLKHNKCIPTLSKSKTSCNRLDTNKNKKLCYDIRDERGNDKLFSRSKHSSSSPDEDKSASKRRTKCNYSSSSSDEDKPISKRRTKCFYTSPSSDEDESAPKRKRRSSNEELKSEILPNENGFAPQLQRPKRKFIDTAAKSSSTKKSKSIKTSSDEPDLPVSEKQDLTQITKGMTGYLEIGKKKIKDIISDVDNEYIENLINKQEESLPISEVVNIVIESLLENGSYPKESNIYTAPSTSRSSATTTLVDTIKYDEQSISLLQNNFQKIPTNVLRKIFSTTKNYTKSYTEIKNILEKISSKQKKVEDTAIHSFLRGKRAKIEVDDLSGMLTEEVELLEKGTKKNDDECDIDDVQQHNKGHSVECGCCYDGVTFEDMVQCVDGHLFCVTCLQSYSKEAVYGSSKIQLCCMSQGCDSTFPRSQLKKALTEDMMEKYMERVQNEDLKLANLPNLVKCPNCEFAADMDDELKVFYCQNPSCMKQSCRYCKEDWKDHIGVSCKEVEKEEVTNLRTSYEEKMTQAKARKCWQCGTLFVKFDGCNKMTCRCGAKMCYVCRQGKIDYAHFCEHPRNPGESCSKCKKCSLWTDPSEDDDRAVAEIKQKAEEESVELAGNEGKSKISIGPASSSSVNNESNRTKPQGYHEYYGSSEDESDDSDNYRDTDDTDDGSGFGSYRDDHRELSDDTPSSSSSSNSDSEDAYW